MAALGKPGSVAEQLEGFLQKISGAFWERTAASSYGDELMSAKSALAPQAVGAVMVRILRDLARYLKRVAPKDRSVETVARRKGWIDQLEFSSRGFKLDRPSSVSYRRCLTGLMESLAADIEANRG